MDTKYGFVALLDALGTKTASIDESKKYLDLINNIKELIKLSLAATLDNPDIDPKIFDELSIHFFGDTLLITYEIKDKNKEVDYFSRISFVLQLFICNALKLGLLFRGSLSIGEYVDKDAIALGPAISDAATWYEKIDMIGVILTPHATLSLKSILRDWGEEGHRSKVWNDDIVLGKHPLKDSKDSDLELFAINWISVINLFCENMDREKWFYQIMKTFKIPSGTESKFMNTERFFQLCYTSLKQNKERSKE
jgi:hypothetical protein